MLLSPTEDFLIKATKKHLSSTTGASVHQHKELSSKLSWRPSLWYKSRFEFVAVEISETQLIPGAVAYNYAEISHMDLLISVYISCPEDIYLNTSQKDIQDKLKFGYGFITVDENGNCLQRHKAIPILQVHNENDLAIDEIKGKNALKRAVLSAWQKYKVSPKDGVGDLCDILEGCVSKAVIDGNRKNWLEESLVNNIKIADKLSGMQKVTQFQNCSASIGGAQHYYSRVRNPNKHAKSQKDAAQLAKKHRADFSRGIQVIADFVNDMKRLNLSGKHE